MHKSVRLHRRCARPGDAMTAMIGRTTRAALQLTAATRQCTFDDARRSRRSARTCLQTTDKARKPKTSSNPDVWRHLWCEHASTETAFHGRNGADFLHELAANGMQRWDSRRKGITTVQTDFVAVLSWPQYSVWRLNASMRCPSAPEWRRSGKVSRAHRSS